MPVFQGLDKALRWLRLQAHRKQRDVAQAAGITQAMLCSYEQGKRVPSLPSLEKILDTLGADLGRLAEVMALVADEPLPPMRRPPPPAPPLPDATAEILGAGRGRVDVSAFLGLAGALSPEKEAALQQILDGVCQWLRILIAATPDPPAHAAPGDRDPDRRHL
jgi:transcriptional regulator with XRE-family HTH domain